MPDNYVGVFHERAAKVHRFVPRGHKEMLFIVEVPFLGWMREALLHLGKAVALRAFPRKGRWRIVLKG